MKTIQRTTRLATTAIIVLASPALIWAQQASLTVLGSASGTDEPFCGATAISDNARAVGGYARSMRTADGRSAALWLDSQEARELRGFSTKNLWGDLRDFTPTGAMAVGSSTLGLEAQPLTWTAQAGTQALQLPVNYRGGEAWGVSDNGKVAVGFGNYTGSYFGRPVHLREAMVWKKGQPTALGFLSGGVSSQAYDVSGNGRVIVGESHIDSNLGEHLAVLWVDGVGPLEIGDLPGGYQRSRAVAVSRDGGTVAGWGSKQFHPFIHRMFRWTRTGGIVDLGVAPGHLLAEATAMTPDGKVIVGWGQEASSMNRTPVIWDQQNGVRDLVVLLESAGVDLSNWRNQFGQIFMQATDVSADGKTIVGFGNHQNHRRGWIATLP